MPLKVPLATVDSLDLLAFLDLLAHPVQVPPQVSLEFQDHLDQEEHLGTRAIEETEVILGTAPASAEVLQG
ncbi:hypothetical protein D4764_03G0005810 [Takifugu flavidus]|uniref:Uncharacterized protein n=1 Tax=Takifugu flavidus TaxID=433684 RepID=A0A5C6N8T6_9TELE|nr:hypothetical protein D4764_03G0005810 [Takifugu flavidus]